MRDIRHTKKDIRSDVCFSRVREEGLEDLPLRVALMGCVVNGPGEAREADVGVAGGIHEAVLFRHGEIVEKIPEDEIIPRLIAEIKKMGTGRHE